MPAVSDPKKEQSEDLICEFIQSRSTKRLRNVSASWRVCALRERKTEAMRALLAILGYLNTSRLALAVRVSLLSGS